MNKRVKSNSVRIIAGEWRGRRLPVPDFEGLRPTINRVRETLFNWLMHECHGARALDLFAGSGALGLECLSRGAAYLDFVESNENVASTIVDNLTMLEALDRAKVWPLCAQQFLQHQATGEAEIYDIVFLDPPFDSGLLPAMIDLLESTHLLKSGAYIYIEYASKQRLGAVPNSWQAFRQGKAGQSQYHLYCRD